MKISILIPVYNEQNTILAIIDKVRKAVKDIEIIIIDDYSTDGTRELLEKININNCKVIYHQQNLGKGAALKTGVSLVTGEIVIIQDADLEYDPSDYQELVKPIIENKAEVVYGSRFIGPHRNLFFWHLVANQFLNLVTNILYNTTLSDMETCYKAFKSDLIKGINWKSKRFDFEPEITAKILKRKIYIFEVPISYFGRDYSQGKKIGMRDFFQALWALIKYRFID
jgi:glycosyltransferase involved in cell wall biosynthesis